ncbi:hypothetical protein UH38_12950 [Aliterella atlantica CENA595]|uniref:Uncharacterized protein n=1 Tax=Aliterella atlantica CENA595 TaxID=1618023 RepID=A0A0D8ZRL6_9CYAN|nr:hypothetical protein UH38_12950 [Aliterella atlantica CENA595]
MLCYFSNWIRNVYIKSEYRFKDLGHEVDIYARRPGDISKIHLDVLPPMLLEWLGVDKEDRFVALEIGKPTLE